MKTFAVFLGILVLAEKGLGSSPTAMIGVGEDNRLYTRSKENGSWRVAAGETCCVIAVAEMPDGSLLGVGEDNQLYTKQKPGVGEWEGPIPRSCCLIDIAVMDDGTIFGVNMKRRLVVRSDLESDWVQPPKACCTKSINILPDGRLIGLAKNGRLRIRNEIGGRWSYFKSLGPRMRDVSVDPQGSVYGVSSETCGVYKLDKEAGTWEDELQSSECMLNIVSTDALVPPNIE